MHRVERFGERHLQRQRVRFEALLLRGTRLEREARVVDHRAAAAADAEPGAGAGARGRRDRAVVR